MNTKQISRGALDIIDQYRNFRIENAICSIPYFNNKTTARRAGLRAEVGKGSPKDIFDEMNIEIDTPASGGSKTAPAAAPAATAAQPTVDKSATAAPAMNTNQILKSYEMMTPTQRAQMIKDFEIINDRDRLATGTNESLRSQRKI